MTIIDIQGVEGMFDLLTKLIVVLFCLTFIQIITQIHKYILPMERAMDLEILVKMAYKGKNQII